ncbi:MAG: helix-turn-helix domain-containing protein [Oscillospiraceae bacterium]|nr:helix-turn-helix domain-containing protein [Oscillospiraceae bacterium]
MIFVQFDYAYLCEGLGRLSGLETRVYQNGAPVAHHQPYAFQPDLAGLVAQRIAEREGSVFYLETDDLLLFGVVRAQDAAQSTLIIGPTAQIAPGSREAIAALHQLGESYGRLRELQAYFRNMVPYPLENFLGILTFLNYAINGEKLSAADLILRDGGLPPPRAGKRPPELDTHNTYEMEKQMLACVTAGNMAALEAFLRAPTMGRVGELAQSELRQRKNTLIVAATLISRAAIAGGLPAQTAFALSDAYIQKAELLSSGQGLMLLTIDMLTDYTRRVSDLKYNLGDAPLPRAVLRHILQNLDKKLTTAGIASALGMNRPHLCERFKQETGQTLSACVTTAKIDEAKRLLQNTDLTAAQISEYLAFSSQSHFQTVFKKAVGCTPKAFRERP